MKDVTELRIALEKIKELAITEESPAIDEIYNIATAALAEKTPPHFSACPKNEKILCTELNKDECVSGVCKLGTWIKWSPNLRFQ